MHRHREVLDPRRHRDRPVRVQHHPVRERHVVRIVVGQARRALAQLERVGRVLIGRFGQRHRVNQIVAFDHRIVARPRLARLNRVHARLVVVDDLADPSHVIDSQRHRFIGARLVHRVIDGRDADFELADTGRHGDRAVGIQHHAVGKADACGVVIGSAGGSAAQCETVGGRRGGRCRQRHHVDQHVALDDDVVARKRLDRVDIGLAQRLRKRDNRVARRITGAELVAQRAHRFDDASEFDEGMAFVVALGNRAGGRLLDQVVEVAALGQRLGQLLEALLVVDDGTVGSIRLHGRGHFAIQANALTRTDGHVAAVGQLQDGLGVIADDDSFAFANQVAQLQATHPAGAVARIGLTKQGGNLRNNLGHDNSPTTLLIMCRSLVAKCHAIHCTKVHIKPQCRSTGPLERQTVNPK